MFDLLPQPLGYQI